MSHEGNVHEYRLHGGHLAQNGYPLDYDAVIEGLWPKGKYRGASLLLRSSIEKRLRFPILSAASGCERHGYPGAREHYFSRVLARGANPLRSWSCLRDSGFHEGGTHEHRPEMSRDSNIAT
jgi:hypothetical protein